MKILDYPTIRQTYKWDCGANVVQSVLEYYGIDRREEAVIDLVASDKQGTSIKNILRAFKKFKMKVKSEKMTVEDIRMYIDRKIPVIIVLQAWTDEPTADWKNDWSDGHYAVAIGYDKKKIYFEDPSCFNRTYLTYEELEDRWHDIGSDGQKYINWGVAVFGKNPVFKSDKVLHMD